MNIDDRVNVTFGSLLDQVHLPKMYRVRQSFSEDRILDVRGAVRSEMKRLFAGKSLEKMSIAVTAGSRGISHGCEIMEEIIGFFKEQGAIPFVVPSMGSHGGGTPEGQLEMLAHLGLSPEGLGVEFRAEMDVIPIGKLSNGTPVYFSKAASQADGIFIWNKIKPHADFKAEHESGLVKMLAIGLGKHVGCASLHQLGFENFSWVLPEAAELILKTQKILGGLAVVENAYDQPMCLEAVAPERIMERDGALLRLAKENMATLRLKDIDVLIVDEIGKNISGEGMDPNVTGRPGSYLYEGFDSIKIKSMNHEQGVLRYSIVTSGKRLSDQEVDEMCETVRAIKEEVGISVCVSFGLLNEQQFQKLKQAGVTRVHNNLETSRRNFPNICTTHTFEEKVQAIQDAQAVGLSVCSGGIMGLGETMKDRIDMAFTLRELGIQSVPINMLNPIPGTPFGNREKLTVDDMRRIVAVYRFILPAASIRLAGGRGLLPDKGKICLQKL